MSYINGMLPNLDTLHITDISQRDPDSQFDDPIHFQTVKHLIISTSYNQHTDIRMKTPFMTFEQLQSFQIDRMIQPKHLPGVFEMFTQNSRTLQTVEIATERIMLEQLTNLVASLPAVKQLMWDWPNTDSVRDLIIFLTNDQQLDTVTVRLTNHCMGVVDGEFDRITSSHWVESSNKSGTQGHTLSFVRSL